MSVRSHSVGTPSRPTCSDIRCMSSVAIRPGNIRDLALRAFHVLPCGLSEAPRKTELQLEEEDELEDLRRRRRLRSRLAWDSDPESEAFLRSFSCFRLLRDPLDLECFDFLLVLLSSRSSYKEMNFELLEVPFPSRTRRWDTGAGGSRDSTTTLRPKSAGEAKPPTTGTGGLAIDLGARPRLRGRVGDVVRASCPSQVAQIRHAQLHRMLRRHRPHLLD